MATHTCIAADLFRESLLFLPPRWDVSKLSFTFIVARTEGDMYRLYHEVEVSSRFIHRGCVNRMETDTK